MTDAEIDEIYNWVDSRFRENDFESVDSALLGVSPADPDLALTWLTATLPEKSKLANRGVLLKNLSHWFTSGLE